MNKATLKSLIREAKKEMIIKSIKENFDVDNDGDWNDPKKAGYMRQKDVAMGHGTVHFTSNSGTSYKVELSAGRIVSVIDGRDNTYEVPEIQKYWDKGFPLIGAIAATIGDNSSEAGDDEKQSLYPPEELQETNDNVGHLKEDKTAVESPGVIGKNEQSPPGFPRVVYEKLVIKFKGNKDKINEVMWKLHNEYGEKLKAAAGLVNEDTLDEK
jgi:hypothetical protein